MSIPNWQTLKRKELKLLPIENPIDSDYLLLGVLPTIGLGEPIIELISVTKTLNDFLAQILKRIHIRIASSDEIVDIFVTKDEAGDATLGRRTSQLKDLGLVDGQLLFLKYLKEKYAICPCCTHTEEELKLLYKWVPATMADPGTMPRVCGLCGKKAVDFRKPRGKMPTHSHISACVFQTPMKICTDCMETSLSSMKKESIESQMLKVSRKELRTYTCVGCGSRGAGLAYDPEGECVITKCMGHCQSHPANRECGYCGKPMERLLVCSGCRKAKYCSEGCQRGDWGTHRGVCGVAE